jgi:hypothetical protein
MTISQTTNLSVSSNQTFPAGKDPSSLKAYSTQKVTNTTTDSGAVITSTTIGPSKYNYYSAGQAFQMTAFGLKPSTVHTFSFNNVDVSANCKPFGGVLGSPLTSDYSGKLQFTFYYNSGITTGSNVTAAQSLINSLAGNKVGILSNSDGTSTANVTISVVVATS